MLKAIKGFIRGVAVDLTSEKIVRQAEDWASVHTEKAMEMGKEFKKGYDEGKIQAQGKDVVQEVAKKVSVVVDTAMEAAKQVKETAPKIIEMVKENKPTTVADSHSEEKK